MYFGKDLISIDELANELGVCIRTIYNWRESGRMPEPTHLIARKLMWDRGAILEWFENGTRPEPVK